MSTDARAVVIHGVKDLRIEAVAVRDPGPGEALVRMDKGGICGSDLHYFFDGGFGAIRVREPMVLGHEISGFIESVGPGVEGLSPGILVAVNPSHACGQCAYCTSGEAQHCTNMRFLGSAARLPHTQGGFRERMVLDAVQCLPMGLDVSAAEAACAEPLSVCLHAVNQAPPLAGKHVLVTGSGPIGVLTVAAARHAGAASIVATDIEDAALSVSSRIGATHTVNVRGADALETFTREHGRFDVAFECSGNQAAVAAAIGALLPRGTLVQVGLTTEVKLPLSQLVTKEIVLRGTFRFATEFAMAAHLIATREIDVRPMITGTVPLADATEGFIFAADRSKACKVQLDLSA